MRKRVDLPNNWNDDSPNYSEKIRNNIHSLPFYFGIVTVIYLLLLTGAVYYIDKNLPTALNVQDEKTHPDSFIAERAINDLEVLTNIGPRVVGSYENEVLATDFLKREIEQIKLNANANQKLELDIQLASGSYYVNLLKTDNINIYTKIKNIVVKIHGVNETDTAVLINSHFDSVPTSPGGSDDGINVVAMLEVLRKLSKSPQRPLHNIIFLFNGAEETVLQAAHGFITQHKWAKECKVILNLEACGAGGKITLFQTGPGAPWLVHVYKHVPHPSGRVAGEEIFQSGMIPSDTDFRIFRDFGKLVGMDMAFYKYGYRYHTKYDDFKNIPAGSYQQVGDNTLHLVKALANAPELFHNLQTGEKVVYYDVFGLFMMVYSVTAATIINSAIVFLSGFVFVWSIFDFKLDPVFASTGIFRSIKYLAIVVGSIIGGWILSFLFVALLTFLLDCVNYSMSWYGTPVLIIGLFAVPTIAITGHILSFVNHEKLSLNIRLQVQAHLVRLIWTVILLVGTALKIRSMYPLTILISFSTLAFLLIHLLRLHRSVRIWQIIYLICLIIPTCYVMYELFATYYMFIPLTGRIGSDKNPDLIIGSMTVLGTLLITSSYVALSNVLRQGKYYFICLWLVFLASLVIVFTPWGFPYSGDWSNPTPQRFWMTHAQRVFYNETGNLVKTEGGIFMLNMDRNSPNSVKSYVKDLSKAKPLKEDCDRYILCGLPLSHVKMTQIMEYSSWIPANQPKLPFASKFVVNLKKQLSPTVVRYNVSMTGPDRQYVFMVPKEGMKMVNISLLEKVPKFINSFHGRPLVFLNSVAGESPTTLTITFDMEVPENYEGPTMDIAISSIFVHSKTAIKTPYYQQFLQQFPDWADLTAWIGSYAAYVA
ncbi:endoplasmic reticulum metallopeptidase 1-like isoform X1 [Diabrotica virgifera virgifera]|uniref:Endoplasmic reticulum metallopeptidase 1-like n=1 Tax=Diabrotica virgifera virgifera TaxID=50390 RepID=A0ABM5JQJ6_DIAVI|nr:endoplasmic reticulum metallopeptidase 1-like isoform X1 [Diabrotica virgifera virgifera]